MSTQAIPALELPTLPGPQVLAAMLAVLPHYELVHKIDFNEAKGLVIIHTVNSCTTSTFQFPVREYQEKAYQPGELEEVARSFTQA